MGFVHLAAVVAFVFFAPVTAQQQTFIVQSMVTDQKAAIGAAVVVARDRDTLTLATAAHAILPHCTLRILDQSRREYYHVIGVRTLPVYDLAFVRVRAQSTFAVQPVEFGAASLDEAVFVWGHADGLWRLATGSVDETAFHIAGTMGTPRVAITCAHCAPGDSGSGVFDAQGRLLGILTRAWRASNGRVMFIEVEPSSLVAQQVTLAFEEPTPP